MGRFGRAIHIGDQHVSADNMVIGDTDTCDGVLCWNHNGVKLSHSYWTVRCSLAAVLPELMTVGL